MLKVLDLFSGIGGFSLGLESTRHFSTTQFVEQDAWCQKILAKNFPGVPIHDDINSKRKWRLKTQTPHLNRKKQEIYKSATNACGTVRIAQDAESA